MTNKPSQQKAKKRIYYLFSDGSYSGIALPNFSAIREWIKSRIGDLDIEDEEEVKEQEFTIRLTLLTKKEYDALQEAD